MPWDFAWGGEANAGSSEFVTGGVGEIDIVLRVDVKKVVAVHARPYDPNVSAEIDLFLSTVPYMSFPTDTPASTRFDDILEKGYDFEATLFSGREIASRSLPSVGDGVINNSDDKRDFLQRLHWGNRQWDVFIGEQDQQFSAFTLVWPGKAGREVALMRDRIEVPLEDIGKRFDQPVQTSLYTPGFEPYVSFDGTDDSISFGDVLDRGTSGFHFGVAFRTTTASQTAGLYAKKATQSGTDAGYGIGLGSTGAIRFDVADGTTNFAVTHTPADGYDSGERIAVVVRVNRTTNVATMFVKVGSGAWSEVGTVDISTLGNVDNAIQLYVGRRGNAGHFLTGEVERVASRTGGGDTITATFQGVFDEPFADDVDASALDHYVPLTENIGTTVGDISLSGFDGTIDGGAQWTGLQGGSRELDGQPKPLAYGDLRGDFVDEAAGVRRMRVEPAVLDPVKLIYQWHDGASEALDAVEDKGAELVEDTGFTGDIFLDDLGPDAGEYTADLTRSLFRLGSPPQGKVTCAVRGDNSPTYTDQPHLILRRIAANHAGIDDPTGMETEAFDALGTQPGVGIYIRGESIGQVFDELMGSIFGWWALGRTALLTVGQLREPDLPDAEVRFDEIVAESLKRLAVPAVHWRDRIGYGRNWTPQGEGELIVTLTPKQKTAFTQQYEHVDDENAAIKPDATGTPHLDSADVETLTLVSRRGDSASHTEALEILDLACTLFGVEREIWEARLAIGVLQFWLGDVVEFPGGGIALPGEEIVTRYQLEGRKFLVIGIRETPTQGVTLTLWGSQS